MRTKSHLALSLLPNEMSHEQIGKIIMLASYISKLEYENALKWIMTERTKTHADREIMRLCSILDEMDEEDFN